MKVSQSFRRIHNFPRIDSHLIRSENPYRLRHIEQKELVI